MEKAPEDPLTLLESFLRRYFPEPHSYHKGIRRAQQDLDPSDPLLADLSRAVRAVLSAELPPGRLAQVLRDDAHFFAEDDGEAREHLKGIYEDLLLMLHEDEDVD